MPQEVQLALGRIFRLMSRPAQPGDVQQYYAARAVVLEYTGDVIADWQPDYGRDRMRGAAGG